MKIEIYQPLSIHEIGRRDNQEDALWREGATADDRLFIVCDGMGGHEKGEVASQTFSEALGKWYSENANPDIPLDNPQLDEQLSTAIEFAYRQLDAQDDGGFKKMGTTLTLLYIHARGVLVAHIGDSRIYHIRPSERILYQSRDHSLVYDLYQAGEIAYEEMTTHPQKNVITKAVTPGEENRATPDVIHITDIEPDDYFYMCSDGMLEKMSNGELFELFSAPISDEEKRHKLIDATIDNADNHTAWIIRVKSVLKEAGDAAEENEETTARCNALNISPIKHKEEIQIVDDNDVQVVGMAPSKTRKGKSQKKHGHAMNNSNERLTIMNKIKRWLYPVLCCLALAVAGILVYQSVFKDTRKKREMPVTQKKENSPVDTFKVETDTLKVETTTKPASPIDAQPKTNGTKPHNKTSSKPIPPKKDKDSEELVISSPIPNVDQQAHRKPNNAERRRQVRGEAVKKATEGTKKDDNPKPVDIRPQDIDTQKE